MNQTTQPGQTGVQAGVQAQPQRLLNERALAPGEFVFQENDPGDFGYVVVSGTVEICKITDGKHTTLAELGEGALFGEMAIIDKQPRSAAARAKTEAVVREVDERALMAHFTRSPELAISIMKRLSSYVRTSNQALEKDVFDSVASTALLPREPEPLERLSQQSADNAHIINSFQTPAEAIIRSRIPPVVRITLWSGFLLFFAFVLWASFSVIDTTVSASGKITTTVPKISVQSGQGSTVKQIHVSPGQVVKRGAVLITLDPTLSDADYAKMRLDVAENQALIGRLQLEKREAPLDAVGRLDHPLQRDIFRSRWQEHAARRVSTDLGIDKAGSALETARSNLRVARLGQEEAQHNFGKQQRLVREGILSETALKEEQFKVDKAAAAVANAEIALRMAQGDLDARQADRKSFMGGWFKQINEELSAALVRRDQLHEELVKMEHQRANIQVVAPADGVVLEMEKIFVGAMVSSGQAVMTLVPVDVPLMIEMDVEPKDISNVVVGNTVSAKLSALPFQKHGDLGARITFVSEDTVGESINGDPGSFYRARAEIVANNLQKLPPNFRLVPGMQLNGDIRVAKRRVITYFLYPVIRTLDTSFTEP